MDNEYLVSPEYVKEQLGNKRVRIIEAPWKCDGYGRAHIPGAICLPVDSYLKEETAEGELTWHVFDAAGFQKLAALLGMCRDEEIIVYDDYHGLFATRFWWVCHYFGFDGVRVMNGGWHAWLELGYPVSAVPVTVNEGKHLEIEVREEAIIRMDDLKALVGSDELQVWDARRPEEYCGTEETTNRRLGHVPGAINLLWTDLLTEEAYEGGPRYIESIEKIQEQLDRAGFKKDRQIVTHCQAAIRGAFASFVLAMLGYPNHRLYDGSMAEWANHEDTPLEIPK